MRLSIGFLDLFSKKKQDGLMVYFYDGKIQKANAVNKKVYDRIFVTLIGLQL